MSTKKNDGDRFGFTKEDAQGLSLTESQCSRCVHSRGFNQCAVFGIKPDKYAMVSANVTCPRRKGPKYD